MFFSFPPEKFFEKEQRQLFFRRLIRRVFLEDWGTKLVALGITAALWLGVTGLQKPTSRRLNSVPLVLNFSSEMEATNSPLKEVDIVVTGDKTKVSRLRSEDLVVSIDLTDITPGERTIQLTPENINVDLPSGLKIDEIQPGKIAVKLERVEEREIAVKPETEGALPDGFEVYAQAVNPAKVRVRGPESIVKSLDSISTEKILVDNRTEDFTQRQVGLNVVNPKITVLDTIVEVTFRIGEKRTERLFVVPYRIAETETKNATVLLYGARSILEDLSADELQIVFSPNQNGENAPQLVLPPEIQGRVEVKNFKIK
ncbi:MAG: CdaR family protein [Acidobacteriota bacterium]|nr:CdaR family protein [Acidobacteriota bacterium]